MDIKITRNQTADILKGLAVIFMIQIHIMEKFASAEVSNSLFGNITFFLGGPFCAPVFIAVMGYFLANSQKSFGYFLKRGVLLFLLGILLNMGRTLHLFIAIFQGKFDFDPLFYIFGADILPLAGLSIILLGFLRLISKRNLFLYIPVFLAFATLDGLINTDNLTHGFYWGFILGDFDHTYFPLIPWFSYVLAGYIFKILYDRFSEELFPFSGLTWTLIFLILALIVIFANFAFKLSINLDRYYHHHTFLFILWVLGFMLIYALFIRYLSNNMGDTYLMKFIAWTGQQVTVIYVVQWLLIGNIATSIYQSQDLLSSELWFGGIAITSCLIAFGYQKIQEKRKVQEEGLI